MTHLKRMLLGLVPLLAATMVHAGTAVELFDGKTLAGWEGNLDVFRVEDGAIVAGSLTEKIPRNEFLCSEKEYDDFELQLTFKISGDPKKANAGVQIRSRRIPNHHEMIGYQADIGQHYWGSIYDESRRRKILAKADMEALSKVLKKDGWNTYRMRCEGRRVRLWINGQQTVDYIEPDKTIEQKGVIGLQIHSGPPCVVRYKDITIRELKDGVPFTVAPINPESPFEAACAFDVNNDGKTDIFCGGFWYEAPTWKAHVVRELQPKNEYYNDFANLPLDVNGDGWTDVVNAAWFTKSVFWLRNPGKAGGPFELIDIDVPGNSETAFFCDVSGDGQPDLVPNCVRNPVWYEFLGPTQGGKESWRKHELPKVASGHGLGAGDVNGDGRTDIIAIKGWLEQTGEGCDNWTWHPEYDLGDRPSIPIPVHDVDGDGDNDIIWGAGHGHGLFWLEQKSEGGKRAWKQHEIDKTWSQAHFLLMEDLDADGEAELITGKRYRAHNGKDAGGSDPRCVHYYRFNRGDEAWVKHTLTEGEGVGFGINTMACDIDGDGDKDLVAPGKSGLYLLLNGLN